MFASRAQVPSPVQVWGELQPCEEAGDAVGLTVAWLGTRRFHGNCLPRVKVPVRVLFVSLGAHGDVVSWSAACHWLPTSLVLLFASVIRCCAALSSQHALIKGTQRGPHHTRTAFWQGWRDCGGEGKRDVGLKPLLSVPW